MKLSIDAKAPDKTNASNMGEYTEQDLDQMVECMIQAHKIESDPQVYAMVKDYAQSKHKLVDDVFTEEDSEAESPSKVKSLADVKKIYKSKVDKGE